MFYCLESLKQKYFPVRLKTGALPPVQKSFEGNKWRAIS